MKFHEAMALMAEGKKVRRRSWLPGLFWRMNSSNAIYRQDDGEICGVHVNYILADDWEEYEEPGHDITWAIEQLRAGNIVSRRKCVRFLHPKNILSHVFSVDDVEAKDWITNEV